MGNNNRNYNPVPVEIPLEDNSFFDRPFFAYGIFKKGQLAYSKIADCVEYVEPDEVHREMHIRDGVPVIKNEYSRRTAKGEKIHFLDGREADAYEKISHTQLGNVYGWDTIEIGREKCNILVTQKMGGTFLNMDKNGHYLDFYDGKNDFFFSNVSRFIRNELEGMDFDDDCTIFKIQMYYMLLWSAIERYCVLKYDVSNNQGGYLRDFADDEIFQEAVDAVNPKSRNAIHSSRNASSLYFNKNRPNFIVNYYYTIRSNITHRGKEPGNNFEALIDSLNEMLDIFDHVIKRTFNENDEG